MANVELTDWVALTSGFEMSRVPKLRPTSGGSKLGLRRSFHITCRQHLRNNYLSSQIFTVFVKVPPNLGVLNTAFLDIHSFIAIEIEYDHIHHGFTPSPGHPHLQVSLTST
jgi:hypothetical protein